MSVKVEKDEEQVLVKLLMNGDKEARNQLIEKNFKLVIYIAKKFDNYTTTIEDLISVGSIGLIKAIETFNLDKNIKLATYASRCIENEILMYFRKNKRLKSEISFNEPLKLDANGNPLLLSDILGTEEQLITRSLERKIENEHVKIALNKLKPRERYLMVCRFGLFGKREMSQQEVAEHLGISQSYISRLEKKILLNLRGKLKNLVVE